MKLNHVFLSTIIFEFRFDEKKYHQPLQPEPTICVTHPALALKMLRNFGHLIVNLSLDYILFYTPDIEFNNSCGGIELIKMIEEYLAEYCSGTLCQLSLQNSDRHYPILKDIKKQFLKVKTLQTDHCYFGEELPFNKFFPNLQTLNLGFNHFENKSHIVHLRTVKNLSIDFLHIKFEEENIQEFFKLNLQLERAKICLIRGFNPDLFPRLKEICPNVKSVFVLRSPFHYDEFVCGDLEYETKKKYQYPANTSDTYKKNLENLYYRYRKNLTGVDVRKQTYD